MLEFDKFKKIFKEKCYDKNVCAINLESKDHININLLKPEMR